MKKQITFVYLLFALAVSAQEVQYSFQDGVITKTTTSVEEIDSLAFAADIVLDNLRLAEEQYLLTLSIEERAKLQRDQRLFLTNTIGFDHDSLYTKTVLERIGGTYDFWVTRPDTTGNNVPAKDRTDKYMANIIEHPNTARLVRLEVERDGTTNRYNVLPISPLEIEVRNWDFGGVSESLFLGKTRLPNGREAFIGRDSGQNLIRVFVEFKR